MTSESTTLDTPNEALSHAASNMAALLEQALEQCGPDTVIDNVDLARNPRADVTATLYPRFGFTVTVDLAQAESPVTFDVVMPGLPLDRVNFGARPEDKGWQFPRLQIAAASSVLRPRPEYVRWWWPSAVEMVTKVLDAVAQSQRYPNLVITELLLRQHATGNGTGLGFGYSEGLPIDPFAAAWGCRAIVKQSGYIDIVPDRKGWLGDEDALTVLFAKLDGGLTETWRAKASALLHDYRMVTSESQEFTLLYQDGVVVTANTKGSYGYLYVCAALLRDPDNEVPRP